MKFRWVILIFWIGIAVLGGWLWPYSINAWLVYFDKAATMGWWHGFLLGLIPVIGAWCFPVALVTWILMMFLT